MKSRSEFLADLKQRALEIARAGDLVHAVSLMCVEANKREDVKPHHTVVLAGTKHVMNEDSAGVIRWIESFS